MEPNLLPEVKGKDNILSLCEMSSEESRHILFDDAVLHMYNTIYLGSEFCWEKYNDTDWLWHINFCKKNKISVFFVIPIIPNRYLKSFERVMAMMYEYRIDGVVVNDPGILLYIARTFPDLPIVMGRLFVKSSRDFIKYDNKIPPRFPYEVIELYSLYKCIRIDVDYNVLPCNIEKGIEIGLHSTAYLTSTMRCDYKFSREKGYATITDKCKQECLTEIISIPETHMYKLGNSLHFLYKEPVLGCSCTVIHDYWLFSRVNSDL